VLDGSWEPRQVSGLPKPKLFQCRIGNIINWFEETKAKGAGQIAVWFEFTGRGGLLLKTGDPASYRVKYGYQTLSDFAKITSIF